MRVWVMRLHFECILYWNETGDVVNAFAPQEVHMSMEAREKSVKDNLAPVWTASHGPRCLTHLFSLREMGWARGVP